MNAYIDEIDSPVGPVVFAVDQHGALLGLRFRNGRHGSSLFRELKRERFDPVQDVSKTADARQQLLEYLSGERQTFELSLAARGTTYQRAVWQELGHIPFAETRTYREIADAIGRPGEAKEVGAACAANPILLVIPCHWVVASDGSLRGYAAGLHMKERLLALEKGQCSLAA